MNIKQWLLKDGMPVDLKARIEALGPNADPQKILDEIVPTCDAYYAYVLPRHRHVKWASMAMMVVSVWLLASLFLPFTVKVVTAFISYPLILGLAVYCGALLGSTGRAVWYVSGIMHGVLAITKATGMAKTPATPPTEA